jgi:hypothetical protein
VSPDARHALPSPKRGKALAARPRWRRDCGSRGFRLATHSRALGAKLRLFATDGSKNGGGVYAVPASFTEATLNYATAPALDGTPLAQLGAVATGQTLEIDVTAAVTGDGSFAFGLRNANSDSAYYSSREGASPPQLVIEWVE